MESSAQGNAIGEAAFSIDNRQSISAAHDSLGGEMGERIRAFEWSKTPLGPSESWSPALRMMVRFLLANRFPLLLWWGPEYVSIYNDPYRPVLGAKHPWALGQPVRECWSEIWHILQPLIDTPFNGGPATWNDDIPLEINRYGFVEETHFTIAYSPVLDETVASGIGGVLATVHEITEKVVGERRIMALRDLGARVGEAKTADEACSIAAGILADYPKDVPFAVLYVLDEDRKRARLAGAAGVAIGEDGSSLVIDLAGSAGQTWPIAEVVKHNALQFVDDISAKMRSIPPGPWADPPRSAILMPIRSNVAYQPAAVLVMGLSSRLRFDESYHAFAELLTSQVATAIANARAYEHERKRAEALAEIDRVKTAFFSNVSHEFRTPLTLMLGPLEDALVNAHGALPPKVAEELTVAHRNSLRLLKLVNTLLDFSRIEAGRIQASYEPVDLPAFTAELASVFRSAIERAGLRLLVECPQFPPTAQAYIDREMWEKIVLNLLSNAFKFTFGGEIEVRLEAIDGQARLTVRDTGVGIPAEEIPRVFERFHRVTESRGRTHEGTGIGLALVQELVKLHGGSVHVESEIGRGSCFVVEIPFGKAHLPADRIGAARTTVSTALRADAFVEEALRWAPSGESRADVPAIESCDRSPGPAQARGPRPRIIWADDNADMRDYVRRLLAGRYEVEALADGQAALESARRDRPELILADIMMPRLDGLSLLRQVRADPNLNEIPVLLLSARAGEEARIEGLDTGADDYLVKPFSARELLARVEAHVKMARLRREAAAALRESEERFRHMADHAPVMVWVTEPDATCTFLSKSWYDFTGQTPETGLGFGWVQTVHPDDRPYAHDTFVATNAKQEAFRLEYRLRRKDGEYRWAIDAASPLSAPAAAFSAISVLLSISLIANGMSRPCTEVQKGVEFSPRRWLTCSVPMIRKKLCANSSPKLRNTWE